MSGRKALVIGIDNYPRCELSCCVNDATEISTLLERNEDGTPNFSIQRPEIYRKRELMQYLKRLFSGEDETALFYFAGHAMTADAGTYLMTPDEFSNGSGISMGEIMTMVSNSNNHNNVVILDCCHAGKIGEPFFVKDVSSLKNGTTIMSACKGNETAIEKGGHGIFTELLINGLKGGAADLTGCITPGSLYAYIDKSLGPWDQRPVFKTNVSNFVSLRMANPPITRESLVKITELFGTSDFVLPLDPSFEFTNDPGYENKLIEPYADPRNVSKFKILQELESVGLVTPLNEKHMYFAAMNGGGCKLTSLGKHYWRLVNGGRI